MSDLFILTGASRGMGRAIARQLLQRGEVTLLTLSRGVDAGLEEVAADAGSLLLQWQVDLAEPLGAAQRVNDWLGSLHAQAFQSATLINNAGTVGRPAPLAQADLAELSQALRVGLEAPLLLSSAFLRATRGWAAPRRVLNISSGLGRNAMGSQAPYCASKAGMDHFSRAVALEESAQDGARIVSLAPGVIDTDMQIALRGADAQLFPDRGRFEKLKQDGLLDSPETAAAKVLAWLDRPDFGAQPVADVRQP
ncbi:SDR family NAD(P)-dependent oxidoreductase [Xenophilus arseniciresistens]|uniref:SDR family NAD(P)-dependent oxidoreductase n=1 Tax=Xenophilus arseniciresistens TaxID=1283306 RepID=A0AAE3SZM8_9BURK|nr:SDR family NAD(P)-dependent oxidoreductase [Xenophilus arseniciresistens]MDA7415402.1 SDR family NAD(P)-dependent oxidoreductase [Xenophilus arseniciresistens]